jgi:rod shape-determining protein MreD
VAAGTVNGRTVLRTALVALAALLVQSTVLLDLRIAGVHPDVMLLLPIAAALVAGPVEGAIMGFVAGMAADLLLPTPFGLSALVGCLLGLGVGLATRRADRVGWWIQPVAALVGSAAAVMLYAVLGAILGQEQFMDADLAAIVTVVALINALLSVPACRLVRWAMVSGRDRVVAPATGRRR